MHAFLFKHSRKTKAAGPKTRVWNSYLAWVQTSSKTNLALCGFSISWPQKQNPLGQRPGGFACRKEVCFRPTDGSLTPEEDEGRDMFHLVPHTEWVMSLDWGRDSIGIQRTASRVEWWLIPGTAAWHSLTVATQPVEQKLTWSRKSTSLYERCLTRLPTSGTLLPPELEGCAIATGTLSCICLSILPYTRETSSTRCCSSVIRQRCPHSWGGWIHESSPPESALPCVRASPSQTPGHSWSNAWDSLVRGSLFVTPCYQWEPRGPT